MSNKNIIVERKITESQKRIEGLFSTLVKDIQGSYTNIIGLPVYEVCQDLKKVLK